MRLGILRVNAALLLQALGLPDDVRIHGTVLPLDLNGVLQLKIEHEGLPEVNEGEFIPFVNATLRETVDTETLVPARRVEFMGWS